MQRIIFLDFDGVLNSLDNYRRLREVGEPTGDEYGSAFDGNCVTALRKIVETTGAGIVLTSSWRYFLDMDGMTRMWNDRRLPGKLIGRTPTDLVIDPEEQCKRGVEIGEWLSRRKAVTDYVIIDDDSDFLPDQLPHLIRTDPKVGLTDEDANRAISIINGR